MSKIHITLIVGWFVVLVIFIWNGWTPSYEAKSVKVNAEGVKLFMTEKEVTSILGTEDPEDPNCMGCGPNMDYQKSGIYLRISETKHYVSQIKITNPTYDIAGIHPQQELTEAQRILDQINFKQNKSDSNHYYYQKGKYTIHLITDKQTINAVELKYEIKKDKEIIYKRKHRLLA